ncbi:hypothetical protein L8T07_04410 [Enterobacter asburiae]|uniref:hypothetical protein n=1 Tax=Enterobacter asburiae TaxID=61645 RepID=UPI0020044397|nr:hypothetical protein [Enterobacter asburiae]MCK6666986.1 hypothetical protein [Enterobacter asburiae]
MKKRQKKQPKQTSMTASAPPRRAQRRKINPVNTSGAQCYPRLACPLNVTDLMHLHLKCRTASVLALAGKLLNKKCMQIHAPMSCTAKAAEFE